MQKKFLSLFIITLSLLMYACNNGEDAKLKKANTANAAPIENDDTLSNEPQCNISINDKQFVIPADSIDAAYIHSDSSISITIKGLDGGYMVLTIPNFFKLPGSVPSGYSSARTKIAFSTENAMVPTVELYSYPVAGISFGNLNDGYHKKEITDAAMLVQDVRKTGDSTSSGIMYLIKTKINTTVWKSVYEKESDDNRDYSIKGSLVLKSRFAL